MIKIVSGLQINKNHFNLAPIDADFFNFNKRILKMLN